MVSDGNYSAYYRKAEAGWLFETGSGENIAVNIRAATEQLRNQFQKVSRLQQIGNGWRIPAMLNRYFRMNCTNNN